MRIAIVTDFYYPSLGGITEHVDGQARALTALGHEVTVVTGQAAQPPPVQDDAMAVPEPTFEIVTHGHRDPPVRAAAGATAPRPPHTIGPRLGRRLGAFFRERGFDVVHVHAPYNPQMPAWAIDNTPDDALSVATFHSVFPQTLGMDIQAELIRPGDRAAGRPHLRQRGLHRLAHALLPVRLRRDPQRHRRRPLLARRRAGAPSCWATTGRSSSSAASTPETASTR